MVDARLPCSLFLFAALAGPAAGQERPTFEALERRLAEVEALARGGREPEAEAEMDRLQREIGEFLAAHGEQASDRQFGASVEWSLQIAERRLDWATIEARVALLESSGRKEPRLALLAQEWRRKLALKPGSPAPDWTARDVSSARPARLSELRGKLVLVDFWASWVPPCRSLHRDVLAPLAKAYPAAGLQLVSIGLPRRDDTAEQQRDFAAEQGHGWPHLFDPEGQAAEAYGVRELPHLCLVDEDGKVLVSGAGPRAVARIRAVLEQRLGPPAGPSGSAPGATPDPSGAR